MRRRLPSSVALGCPAHAHPRLPCSPAGARLDDQETFNRVLEPWAPPADVWTRGRRDALTGAPWPPSEFGPARLRVALFDPFDVPSGCRLPEVLRRGLQPAVIHANCNQGISKLRLLASVGQLHVAPWNDADVAWAAAAAALLFAGLLLFRQCASAVFAKRASLSSAARRKDRL